MNADPWLVAGGVLSLIAAALHVAIILGGPAWYRFFGAGERLARAAGRGAAWPALVTLAIALVLAAWAACAFAGAGLLPRPPLLRPALVAISAVYLLRALAFAPARRLTGGRIDAFTLWSSAICLVFGLAYAIGTAKAWSALA